MLMIKTGKRASTIGLMLSGGLDSAILLAHLLEEGYRVQPIYVSIGCNWEAMERQAVDDFVGALDRDEIAPVVDLAMPGGELYGQHWSITGRQVPNESTPDDAVLLPGRNPLLLLKPLLWCGQQGLSRLALATLSANPFADATPQFFEQFQQALQTATGIPVTISRPFENMTKKDVLARAADLPLHLTFSCLSPRDGNHCGVCNKCAERIRALRSLPDGDPTLYATHVAAGIG